VSALNQICCTRVLQKMFFPLPLNKTKAIPIHPIPPPPPPLNIPGSHICWRLSRLHGHNSAAGKFMSMKNSNETVGNRILYLPPCNAVLQPTAPALDLWQNKSWEECITIILSFFSYEFKFGSLWKGWSRALTNKVQRTLFGSIREEASLTVK
jgi:hypothetical protein